MTSRGLVLGGGGITGIAWETGLLWGLAEAGLDLTGADRIVGTSAGSIVGAQITSDLGLEELYRRQLLPPADDAPLSSIGPGVAARFVLSLLRARGDVDPVRPCAGRRIGQGHRAAARPPRSRIATRRWTSASAD